MAGSQTTEPRWVYLTSDDVRRQWKQAGQAVRGSRSNERLVVELNVMATIKIEVYGCQHGLKVAVRNRSLFCSGRQKENYRYIPQQKCVKQCNYSTFLRHAVAQQNY